MKFFCDTISAAKCCCISPNMWVKPFYTISSFRKRWIWAVVLGSLSQKGLFRISSLIIYLLLSPELIGLMSSWTPSPQNLTWCNKNATRFLIFHISLSDWNSSFNDERLFWFWIWRLSLWSAPSQRYI